MNIFKKIAILGLSIGFADVFAADGGDIVVENDPVIEDGTVIAEYGAITVKMLNGKKTAVLSSESKETVEIPEDVVVDSIYYDRDYSGQWGKPGTLILPFDLPRGYFSSFGQIYEMTGIGINGNQTWEIDTKDIGSNGAFVANRPYFVRPHATNMTFPRWEVKSFTMKKNVGVDTKVTFDNWEFRGNYSYKKWAEGDPELGYVYGFAAREKEVNGKQIQEGQFVKGAAGVYIRPFRAHLIYNKNATALAKTAAGASEIASLTEGSLPDTINVIFRDENGDITAIHSLDLRSGEFTVNKTGWYDMKGRKLGKKPTIKGSYFYNGNKVTIK